MSRGQQKFKQGDVTKALKATVKAGIAVVVGDLKRRMLHLKEELERFCNKAIADRRLH
jgi:hypothetical protein